ncbi:ead/Ea22-like family protein [Klebsiella aerogenes]|uniref:ead/Ea22-like family protein n=1 Tax=Klebsiella aerogenes TaxID=548 RepID=UPI002DBD8182|nr:ead/Ea22-like family protein [Klebsiella aerogenes]MEB7619107.1 ead/Ea22-like family protein [Klebsiella aerogenes]
MTDINRLIASLKRRSAHAKEFGDSITFVKLKDIDALVEALEKAQQHIARQEQILLNQDESLSIRRGELEAAQQERESWRTSFDNERFRADKLKAHIDDIEPVRAAAEKLVRCKGRYHSELNYRALAALFGVITPYLPPLEHENVHYADAADMEIAALRQRITELESRTVTVKLPPKIERNDIDGWFTYKGGRVGGGAAEWYNKALDDVCSELTVAGIKVEAE